MKENKKTYECWHCGYPDQKIKSFTETFPCDKCGESLWTGDGGYDIEEKKVEKPKVLLREDPRLKTGDPFTSPFVKSYVKRSGKPLNPFGISINQFSPSSNPLRTSSPLSTTTTFPTRIIDQAKRRSKTGDPFKVI